jgi:hypothetical protein
MPLSLARKMRIKEGMKLLTINAPSRFAEDIDELPADVKISAKVKDYQQIHWFVRNKAEMERDLNAVLKLLNGEVICWIYYPKGSSKIQTDLTRDKGWESLTNLSNLQWLNLISFNDTWSAFAMRLKSDADKKKEQKPKEREIFSYADAATKTIRLPDDLATAIKKSKKASEVYEKLAFSHRREYVEWVVTAKKEETRNTRIKGTVERLEKNWKNPRNL